MHLVAGVERSAPKARFLYGISRVASPCKEVSEEPPRAGEWAGRGTYYRIAALNTVAAVLPQTPATSEAAFPR